MALLVLPVVLMPFIAPDAAAERRELAEAPQVVVDGRPNYSFLGDAGRYIEDHFAFRDALIEVEATTKQALFSKSVVDDVIVGKDGWLFYAGELNDYWRKEMLSDVGIESAAINLSLVRESLAAQGKVFVLAIAPNKSTLYPDRMPFCYVRGEGPSVYERLLPRLRELGVDVVDLASELEGRQDAYFARDSHWNEKGSLVAFASIWKALGHATVPSFGDNKVEDAHVGDLDAMLHPLNWEPETQVHRTMLDEFDMLNDASSTEDAYVVTKSRAGGSKGSLMMYRDSFGNNLILPFACAYESAVFSKYVPYNLYEEQVGFAQDVVIERAERHIASFATDPPYMSAIPRTIVPGDPEEGPKGWLKLKREGAHMLVEGSIGRDFAAGERAYLMVRGPQGVSSSFEAFRVSESRFATQDFEGQGDGMGSAIEGDGGLRASIACSSIADDLRDGDIRLFVGTERSCREIRVEVDSSENE